MSAEKKTQTTKKFTQSLQHIGGSLHSMIAFIRQHQQFLNFMVPVAIIVVGVMIYLGRQTYQHIDRLQSADMTLTHVEHYQQSAPQTRALLQNNKNIATISDMVAVHQQLDDEVARYQKYLDTLQYPYTHLLQYIYLPPLHIWKDYYTDEIRTDMIGIKFLENNPYNDIALIQRWSDFFRNVGDNNEYNTVTDINIGNVRETADGFFRIPITVSFISPSKRSFLLLVDKLSMTSNNTSISLLNEFFYHLREELRIQKEETLQTLFSQYTTANGTSGFVAADGQLRTGKFLGYHLYQWAFHDTANELIDEKIIVDAISKLNNCAGISQAQCFYRFREKYRSIPSLAYPLTTPISVNKVTALRSFVRSIPPVLSIQQFTFSKVKDQQIAINEQTSYQGKVTIDVYGRGITAAEVDEIGLLLGQKCLGDTVNPLTPSVAYHVVDDALRAFSDVDQLVAYNAQDLRELQQIMEELEMQYAELSNYDKIIKQFEIYRMLADANVCEQS